MPEPLDYLTTAQAAILLGVSRQRVLQFVQAGRLPCQKLGRTHLFAPESLLPLIKSRRPAGRPVQPGSRREVVKAKARNKGK